MKIIVLPGDGIGAETVAVDRIQPFGDGWPEHVAHLRDRAETQRRPRQVVLHHADRALVPAVRVQGCASHIQQAVSQVLDVCNGLFLGAHDGDLLVRCLGGVVQDLEVRLDGVDLLRQVGVTEAAGQLDRRREGRGLVADGEDGRAFEEVLDLLVADLE